MRNNKEYLNLAVEMGLGIGKYVSLAAGSYALLNNEVDSKLAVVAGITYLISDIVQNSDKNLMDKKIKSLEEKIK